MAVPRQLKLPIGLRTLKRVVLHLTGGFGRRSHES